MSGFVYPKMKASQATFILDEIGGRRTCRFKSRVPSSWAGRTGGEVVLLVDSPGVFRGSSRTAGASHAWLGDPLLFQFFGHLQTDENHGRLYSPSALNSRLDYFSCSRRR